VFPIPQNKALTIANDDEIKTGRMGSAARNTLRAQHAGQNATPLISFTPSPPPTPNTQYPVYPYPSNQGSGKAQGSVAQQQYNVYGQGGIAAGGIVIGSSQLQGPGHGQGQDFVQDQFSSLS
jgi:hypothetical protein